MVGNISAKLPEMMAMHTELTTQVGTIKDTTEVIKTKLTAITQSFDTTATQNLVEKYTGTIDPIMKKMAETLETGMSALNTDIQKYQEAEDVNVSKIASTTDSFAQPNYQV